MKFKKIKYAVLTKSIGFYINTLGIFAPKIAAQKCYEIFCQPRKGKLVNKKLPEVLQNSKIEPFSYEGVLFQSYTWTGNDEIILLVHGWESNSSRWRKLLPSLLETGKTIIAIDGPAHGLSSGKQFTALKYAGCIEKIAKKFNPDYLIGHSIGGFACVYYQYLNQNPNIKKMILLGAPSDLDLMFENYYQLIGLKPKVQKYLKALVEPKIGMKMEEFAAKNFVKNIKTEALIVHDSKDFIVRISEGKKIVENWNNANFFETKGLGHSLNDKKVFTEIVDFLK